MQPLRNVLVQNVTRAVSADVSDDLPVNPLYCILYTIKAQNLAATTTTDNIPTLANILANVTRLEVLFRGTTIVSGSLQDIMMMNATMCGRLPFIINKTTGLNNSFAVTVPIYLGRPYLKGGETFPATRRGELTLHRVFNSAFTNQNATTLKEQIETIEMLGGAPTSFLKYVTIAKTFLTTGDNDVDFPLGNPLLGALLFGTTGYVADPSTATWQSLKMLVDGVEWTYAKANWETLNGDLNTIIDVHGNAQDHNHAENLAAMYSADATTTTEINDNPITSHYAYLDFDPWEDGKYVMDTQGRGRVWIRATAGTADAARMLPLEIVQLQAGAPAA